MPSSRLSNLPLLPAAWEIALFPAPFEVEGEVLRAGVIVAEADTKHLRLLAPVPVGAPLHEVLREAFTRPAKPTQAGRPSGVRVSSPDLLAELRPLLQEAGVIGSVVDSLPAVTEALAALLTSMGGPVAPGLTTDLPRWREVLRELAVLAPWRRLRDDVRFLLPSDGGGEPSVAVIIGGRGENRGVVVYPSIGALDDHYAVMGTGEMGQLDMVALLMEPAEELSQDERAACVRASLVFSTSEPRVGRLHAKAYVARAAAIRAPDLGEQRSLLRAVQAVVEVCRVHLGALAAGEAQAQIVAGCGPVEIRAGRGVRPSGLAPNEKVPPYFTAHDLRLILSTVSLPRGATGPRLRQLTFKMSKAHALAIAPFLAEVRAVRVISGGGWSVGVAELRDGDSWSITDRMLGEAGAVLERYLEGPEVVLAIAAGGAARPNWRQQDVVASVVVPVVPRRGTRSGGG